MLLKLIGSMIVIIASGFLGYAYSNDCARRPQELRTLQILLQMFENEISFLANLISDAFEKIHKSNDSSVVEFFKSTVNYLKADVGVNASQAWEMAVRENIRKTSLNKEDEEILVSFGKMLGSSDLEGQVKNIRLTISQLKLQEQKAEESRKKNVAMYRSLGLLGGLAIVIVLI